jgi:hypothetical protein
MVDLTKTFGLNVHMHDGFDYDDVHLELRNLIKGFRPIVGLVSMPNGPSTFESITMPNDLDEEAKNVWEVLKAQFILIKKTWVRHYKLFIP